MLSNCPVDVVSVPEKGVIWSQQSTLPLVGIVDKRTELVEEEAILGLSFDSA